jgi:predicted anti-sigma-YlaC factor YlaD
MDSECDYEERVFLYMDGMLDSQESREVEEHLTSCRWCREQVALLSKIQKDFHADIDVPAEFTAGVLDRIEGIVPEKTDSRVPGKSESRAAWAPITHAIAAGIVFISIFLIPGSQATSLETGNLMSSLFTVIKSLHIPVLFSQTVIQNLHFIAAYVTALAALVLYTSMARSGRSSVTVNEANN